MKPCHDMKEEQPSECYPPNDYEKKPFFGFVFLDKYIN